MRASWTDNRLDDLSERMDGRFDHVDGEFKTVRTEMRATAAKLRGEVKEQGEDLRREIKEQGTQLRREMAGMEARLRTHSSELHAQTTETISGVREEVGRLHGDQLQLHAEMHALHRTIARIGWVGMIALLAATLGMLGSALY